MSKDKETYIKLKRGETTTELLKHPNEFMLLTKIALRAKRTENLIGNLSQNQSLIGDYKSIGLTHSKYRTAIKNLVKWKLIAIKTTNKGTVATLLTTTILDINIDSDSKQDDKQMTNKSQTDDKQIATNKNDKNEKKGNKRIKKEFFSKKEVDEIWAAYPNKKSKKDGVKAMHRAGFVLHKTGKENIAKFLIEKINLYIENKNPDISYKNPATWFNGECWNDEYNTIVSTIRTEPAGVITNPKHHLNF